MHVPPFILTIIVIIVILVINIIAKLVAQQNCIADQR